MANNKSYNVPPVNMRSGMHPGRMRVVQKPKNMKGTLRRLWDLTKGHRNGFLWILLLSGLASASAVLSPFVIGKVVTAINQGSLSSLLIITLLCVYVSDWLIRFLQSFFMASISQRIIYHIRTSLFEHMKQLPLSFFDKRQHGELMSRLTNDVDNISTTISNSLSLLLTHCFTIVGILGIMICLSPLLTLVCLSSTVFIFLLTKTVTKHTRKLFAAQQVTLGKLNGQVEESISGLHIVKAYCQEEQMEKDFDHNNEELQKVATKALIWSGFLMPLMNVINNLSFVAISVVSGILAVHNYLEIGMISSFLLYVRQFTRPFIDIANIYNNFQSAVAGAERIFEIFDEPFEPEDCPDALSLSLPKGEIEFKDVVFGYSDSKVILNGINRKIPAGTTVAIVGETGSGKTTLINLLTRFYDVTEGSILLDGHDIRDYKMKELRNAFGVVLQDTALFDESIRANIAYGKPDATRSEIEEAAATAGADSFIKRLPQQYDTILAQGGAELSQGERQLLTIARAVLTNAPILILDEATSSVDTMTEQLIRRAMLKLTKGRTSFIIAHRLSTIRDSDLILLLEHGQITEAGTHDELMQLGGRYAMMYNTQMGTN